jgi:hypothetical protein
LSLETQHLRVGPPEADLITWQIEQRQYRIENPRESRKLRPSGILLCGQPSVCSSLGFFFGQAVFFF